MNSQPGRLSGSPIAIDTTKTGARRSLSDDIAHYRLVTALARQEQPGLRSSGNHVSGRQSQDLVAIATAMNVPIAFLTTRDRFGSLTYTAHGLAPGNKSTRFVTACDELCANRVLIIPNTKTHEVLGPLANDGAVDDLCFLAGIPIRNAAGIQTGCLAVINTRAAVARRGIAMQSLVVFGREISAANGSSVAARPPG